MPQLPPDRFRAVVQDTVLFALDLVVRNSRSEVLVGRRRNAPARGLFFVPGGRVYKGEPMADALRRISLSEIGHELRMSEVAPLGLYEHIYPDNVFDEPGFGTHYVVMGCATTLPTDAVIDTSAQHDGFAFLSIPELLARADVHPFTQAYFHPTPPNRFL